MLSRVRSHFQGAKFARMSSGTYCIIRDLGLVKGGKGMRHHEVLVTFSPSAFLRSVGSDPEGVAVGPSTHWVRAELVAEVAFQEWTRGGRLRQPRFLGLRDDKAPDEVVRERAS